MSSDSEDDQRIPCKYGASCYQKNPTHHAKYKHAKKRTILSAFEETNSTKKRKINAELNNTLIKQDNEINTINDDDDNVSEEHDYDDDIADDVLSMVVDEVENKIQSSKKICLETIGDKKQFIKEKFLVEMPDDFYEFWSFCKKIAKENPKGAFKQLGLTLVGPYDVLDDSFQVRDQNDENYLLHWRYYYDPPEFQTIIKGNDSSGFHMGYFRDSPDEKPVFVATNEVNKNCIIEPVGENVFSAMNTFLEDLMKTADPFKKMSLSKLHKSLTTHAKELNINLHKSTASMQTRHRKTVCKSFHQAGIVVPFNRKTELGYRKLPVDDKELRKILAQVTKAYEVDQNKAFTSLQPLLTAATIANDECDFGTGLEFGLDLFCYGSDCLNITALNVLKITYILLNRRAFGQIAEAHFKNRIKGMPFVLQLQEK